MANAPLGPNESGIARTFARPFGRLIGHTASQSYDPGPGGTGEPSYDTDAAAYFSAVETAGGSFDLTGINATYTESYVKTAHSDFYAGLKTDGVWDKLTEFYLLVGKTFDGLTVKGKGTGTLTNNNFVSGDLLAAGTGAGLSGDNSTKYIDTGLNDNTLNADNKSFGAYIVSYDTNGGFAISASESGGVGCSIYNALNGMAFNVPGTTASIGYQLPNVGFGIGSRRNINDVEVYINGISKAIDTSTSADTNTENTWKLFQRGLIVGGGTVYSDATLTFAHIGTGLTDTDASNLTNRVETLMDALGCGVIS